MALIAIAADKGSPGVTTTSVALAAVWPRPVLLAECDPAGGDLVYRLPGGDGQRLDSRRGLLSLAVAARRGLRPHQVWEHVQKLRGGLDVLTGVTSAEHGAGLEALWGSVGGVLAALPQADVIADCGRIGVDGPYYDFLAHAAAVVMITRATLGEVVRLRERAIAVAAGVHRRGRPGARTGVVVIADHRHFNSALAEVAQSLDQARAPATVLGGLADEPKSADLLRGEWGGKLDKSLLIRTARQIAAHLAEQLPAAPARGLGLPDGGSAPQTPARAPAQPSGGRDTLAGRGGPQAPASAPASPSSAGLGILDGRGGPEADRPVPSDLSPGRRENVTGRGGPQTSAKAPPPSGGLEIPDGRGGRPVHGPATVPPSRGLEILDGRATAQDYAAAPVAAPQPPAGHAAAGAGPSGPVRPAQAWPRPAAGQPPAAGHPSAGADRPMIAYPPSAVGQPLNGYPAGTRDTAKPGQRAQPGQRPESRPADRQGRSGPDQDGRTDPAQRRWPDTGHGGGTDPAQRGWPDPDQGGRISPDQRRWSDQDQGGWPGPDQSTGPIAAQQDRGRRASRGRHSGSPGTDGEA